jgi:hypothetical protein
VRLQLPGGLTPERNLPQYWQKKPLHVRRAIPAPRRHRTAVRSARPHAKLPPALSSLLLRWYLHDWLLIGERHG